LEEVDPTKTDWAKKYERSAFSFSPHRSLTLLLPPAWRNHPHAGIAVLLFIAGLFYLFIATHYPIQRSDDVYYWVGSKSFAMGKGYADITRPDMPPLTKYAPLASLSQAPLAGFAGFNIAKLRFVSIAYLFLASIVAYIVLQERTTRRTALLCLALLLFHQTPIQVICLQGNVGLGALLVWVVLWFVETRFRTLSPTKFTIGMILLLGISFYYHRSYVVIVLAVTLLMLLKRRSRELIVILLFYAIMIFPWMWRSYIHSGHWVSPEYEAEIQERIGGANLSHVNLMTSQTTLEHILVNLKDVPFEIGHRLFPWSRPTFGSTWPFLENSGLGWLGPLSIYTVFILTLIGFVREMILRSRKKPPIAFTEVYLLGQCGMLLIFFFSLNYLGAFLPWLYLYLLRGTQWILSFFPKITNPQRQKIFLLGWVIIFLALMGKNFVVYVLPKGGTEAQNARWRWVTQHVPLGSTVYYEGLDNYANSQWRYIDTERYAVGLTDAQITAKLVAPTSNLHYLCVSRDSKIQTALQANGWKPIVEEPPFDKEALLQSAGFRTPAQRDYILQMEPAQRLWEKE
jgi:hypothetical protein